MSRATDAIYVTNAAHSRSHSAATRLGRGVQIAANDSPDEVTPQERLSWLIELMSRYAREFVQSSDGHESLRLAAAILAHLKSLANDLPAAGRLTEATEHWIEMWDAILSLNLPAREITQQSLCSLVQRARAEV
jgi:hypothetical protein